MHKRFHFSALVCVLAAASLASCSRANYAFQTNAPAYLGTAQVQHSTPTPAVVDQEATVVASSEAIDVPTPTVSVAHQVATALVSAHSTRPEVKMAPVVAAPVATSLSRAETKELKKQVKHRLFMSPKEAKAEGKSQLTAVLLCFFLGGLGIHRFYLGYTGLGILELLTFGVFGILSLIDFIRILIGDLKPKDGEYGKKL